MIRLPYYLYSLIKIKIPLRFTTKQYEILTLLKIIHSQIIFVIYYESMEAQKWCDM